MNSKFLSFIKDDTTLLEKEPFEKLTKMKQLTGFKHKGFWQCMDTLRDKEILEKKIKEKKNIEFKKDTNYRRYRFHWFSSSQKMS